MPTVISHKKKFIYVHVPKTAGTSIARALAPYEDFHFLKKNARRVARRALPRAKAGPIMDKLGIGLMSARSLKASIPNYDSYFTFSFVRNPWDMHVSFYHYLQRDRFHPKHNIARKMSFDDCLKSPTFLISLHQHPYVTDSSGKIIVDMVGRYETLEGDFSAACERIGIAPRLPHLNKSDRQPYQTYYTKETRDLVGAICRKDIELFGYSF